MLVVDPGDQVSHTLTKDYFLHILHLILISKYACLAYFTWLSIFHYFRLKFFQPQFAWRTFFH